MISDISQLKPGMMVYDAHKERMGNTTLQNVGARWNGNEPETFWRQSWKKWRLKRPVLAKTGVMEYRLATRAEIKAMKEKNP